MLMANYIEFDPLIFSRAYGAVTLHVIFGQHSKGREKFTLHGFIIFTVLPANHSKI